MKKIRSLVPVSLAMSVGAIVASCGSFSSPDTGAGAGTGNSSSGSGQVGSSGSGAVSSTGGSADPGSSGSGNTTSTGGSDIGTGGSGNTTSTGGSDIGTGGTGNTTSTGGSGAATGGSGAGTGGSGNISGSGNIAGSGGGNNTTTTPVCDMLAANGAPCVAAHSTIRVLNSTYTGPLYQVCKGSFVAGPASCTSGSTKDIGSVGGYADAAAQDTFCAGATCTMSIIYDQSGKKNDVKPAPAGGAKPTPDNPANATDLKTSINGHSTYGIYVKPGVGYRLLKPNGTATGDQAQGMYMVSSQKNLVNKCCFDYGNAETDAHDDGNGTMEAVYLGGGVVWGTGVQGGPWVEADLENGLFAGWENNQDRNISTNTPLKYDFVTAVVIGDVGKPTNAMGHFALYGGDATAGTLKTMYDGVRPQKTGYNPMAKQGSIILGIGGDNSDSGGGLFYEGVMTNVAWKIATVNALQANIVAARYGK